MVPLYRYWKKSIADHLYTTDKSEIGAGLEVGEMGRYDYRYEGIQCYVFADAESTLEKEMNESPIDDFEGQLGMHEGTQIFVGVGMPLMHLHKHNVNTNGYAHYVIIGGMITSVIVFIVGTICFVNWSRIKTEKKQVEYESLL